MASILVIEDEEVVRELMKEALVKEGYSVEETGRGDEAMRLVREKRYDVVVSDICLPHVHGIEILTFLQKNKPSTKVIMISALGGDVWEECKTAGADIFMTKPVVLEEFLGIIINLLEDVTEDPVLI